MKIPEIKLLPLREAVSTSHPTTLDLLIKIIPPELEDFVERPPLNIGLVLDRSGSMAGQKIEYVRQAATYAVEQLLPTDRVSVTIYDDEIETLVPSTLAVDKVSIIRKIQRISDRGSTALHGGWVQGGIEVSRHLDSEHLNRVILLSDGLANVGETNPDVIASDAHGLAKRGVSTTTMGVGRDYNEDLMEAVARSGDGNYYYIQSPEQLPRIFEIEMQGLMATMGNDVRLQLAPLAGVKVLELLNNLETEGQHQYRLPNLLFDQPVDIVARLKIPPLAQTSELCRICLSWYDPQEQTRVDSQTVLKLRAVPPEELETYEFNPEVRQQSALLMAARAKEEAVDMVDRGDFESASRLLQQTRHEMLNNPDLPMMASEAEALADLEKELKARKIVEYRKLSKFHAHSRHYSHGHYELFYRYNRGPEYGDITRQGVDAIVNSVGHDFTSHGPLSLAVHRAAGDGLQAEWEQLDGCGFGEARITGGHNLLAKWVIHTALPAWEGGKNNEAAILSQCYRSCLELAAEHNIATLAFPALGTGVLDYPPGLAAEIAFQESSRFLRKNSKIGQIRFICFDDTTLRVFTEAFRRIIGL